MKNYLAVLAVIVFWMGMAGQAIATTPVTQYGTGLMKSGYCQVQSVSMYAPTAGDAAMIYDGLTAADSGRKFELIISANNSNAHWDAKGAAFQKGLYIKATDSDVMISVIFDY